MGIWKNSVNFFCVSFVIVTLKIPGICGNQAGRHTYVVRYKHGDSLIPVTVVLDYKRQTEYVINMNSRTPSKSITLYDFKERVIAYKDLKNGECFIGRLTHQTVHNEDAVLKTLKNPVEEKPLILTIDNNRASLTPTEVRNMAGHKAAVFCRRTNTWTLMPEKEHRRERRDTVSYLDRTPVGYDAHAKSQHISHQRKELLESVNASEQANRTAHRELPVERISDHFQVVPSLQSGAGDPPSHHQSNIYPFILPRQRSVSEQTEDRRGSRENLSVHSASGKTSSPQFDFVNGRSSVRGLHEFSQKLLPSILDNETALISPAKHTFIPLNTNHPLIIPSVGITSKFSESNLRYGGSHVSSPGIFTGGYTQNGNSFPTLNSRSENIHNYPPFQQLPPEAFILPLTRPSNATTSPPVFRNLLGYELVHPNGPNNNTLIQNGPDTSSVDSTHDDTSVLPARFDPSAHDELSQPVSDLHIHDVSVNLQNNSSPSQNNEISRNDNISLLSKETFNLQQTDIKRSLIMSPTEERHLISLGKPSNETQKSSKEMNTSSTSRFDDANFSSVERGDLPIDVPRWYPEITKQISIPLEIEVLHHREEYTPSISNRTEEVHSVRGHEIEDHTFIPGSNAIIPIPVETYPNGLRFENDVKLLPQVSSVPDNESFSKDSQKPSATGEEKQGKIFEPGNTAENSYPIYSSDLSNTTLYQVLQRPSPVTNSTEILNSSIDSQYVSEKQQNIVNKISSPTPSYRENGSERNRISKKRLISESAVPVHDFKIDEGVPSYRKRYPAVTQLFTPEETVGNIGRLPDQQFHTGQQNTFRRRRPPSFRNKTHNVLPPRPESNAPWRKHNHEVSRSFINRQQTRLGDQGITFHHRGFPKAGISYDHQTKRFGMLPPGISVHPRHPQAPYADLALGAVDKAIPVKPLLHPRPRRTHLRRHHRRHQRKRNRVLPPLDSSGLPPSNCCSNDGLSCCSSRRRGRHFTKSGCCSQARENRRPNSVLPPQNDDSEVISKKDVQDVEEDRCMREKMCRTLYQSTNKVFICRNIEIDGC